MTVHDRTRLIGSLRLHFLYSSLYTINIKTNQSIYFDFQPEYLQGVCMNLNLIRSKAFAVALTAVVASNAFADSQSTSGSMSNMAPGSSSSDTTTLPSTPPPGMPGSPVPSSPSSSDMMMGNPPPPPPNGYMTPPNNPGTMNPDGSMNPPPPPSNGTTMQPDNMTQDRSTTMKGAPPPAGGKSTVGPQSRRAPSVKDKQKVSKR